ncbi:hypothetical protein AVEN_27316-1, partial [Araneus ventricosus]
MRLQATNCTCLSVQKKSVKGQ